MSSTCKASKSGGILRIGGGGGIGVLLVSLLLTGCATTKFRVTSEPSGASVAVREVPVLYPFWAPQWVQKGTTPCTVVTTKTSLRPNYPLLAFRVSLNTNQTRIVELKASVHPVESCIGPYLLVFGLPSGLLAAAEGGSLVIGVILGVGMTVVGFEMVDHRICYPQTDIHVDFNAPDPNPSPAEVPSGFQRFVPPIDKY